MEELERRREAGNQLDLQADKALLNALQDLSGDIMRDINRLEQNIRALENKAQNLGLRAGTAAAQYRELCQRKYIQQEVGQPQMAFGTGGGVQQPALLTSGSAEEALQEKYAEAISLGTAAFERQKVDTLWKPLPYIYGSPEYLQDSTFGIGPLATGGTEGDGYESPAQSEVELSDKVTAPADDQSLDQHDSEEEQDQEQIDMQIPDFKAMLEAALRGDLDEGLEEELEEDKVSERLSHASVDEVPSAGLSLDSDTKKASGRSGQMQISSHAPRQGTQDAPSDEAGGLRSYGSSAKQEAEDPAEQAAVEGFDKETRDVQLDSAGGPSLHALLYDEGDLFSEEEEDDS